MNEDVKKIYDYVSQMEDFYYEQLTGKNIDSDMLNSIQAGAFQRVRYFIENLTEELPEIVEVGENNGKA